MSRLFYCADPFARRAKRLRSRGFHTLPQRSCVSAWVMLKSVAPLVLLGCVLGVARATEPDTVVRGQPSFAQFVSQTAVDHVATIAVTPIGGPPRTEERVIMRAGEWQREENTFEEGLSVTFSNFTTGVSFSWFRAADGSRETFGARRDDPESDINAYAVHRTGEIQRRLGETCEVFRWTQIGGGMDYGSDWLSCVTRDGVVLWQGYQRRRSGELREFYHATRVERRRVELREVSPPAPLLDWDTWRARSAATTAGASYDVELRPPAEDESGQMLTRRRRGDWRYSDMRSRAGMRSLELGSSDLRMSFNTDHRGMPTNLSIYWSKAPFPAAPSEVLNERDPEVIAGERCVWRHLTPGMADAGSSECQTSDGVPLAYSQWSRGYVGTNVRAVSVGRGSRTEIVPPPEVLSVWSGR